MVAPYEADAQLCFLEREGYVDGIITEDSDLLVFGCKRASLAIFYLVYLGLMVRFLGGIYRSYSSLIRTGNVCGLIVIGWRW